MTSDCFTLETRQQNPVHAKGSSVQYSQTIPDEVPRQVSDVPISNTSCVRPTIPPDSNGFVEILSIKQPPELHSDFPKSEKTFEERSSKFLEDGSLSSSNPVFWPQLLAAVAGGLTHFGMGGMFGFPGVVLPALIDPTSDDLILTKGQASLFSSVINIGSLCGSLISGVSMTWFGQRKTLMIFLPIGALGWLLLGLSPSYGVLIFSRLVIGIVAGIISPCANNYIVEVAHTSIRGRLLAMTDLLRQCGLVFVMVVGSLNLTWRTVALIQISTVVLPFVILMMIPDSPRWLASRQRKEDAHKALTFFRGHQYNVDQEVDEICEQLDRNKKSVGVKMQLELICQKHILPTFLILGLLLCMMHFTGNITLLTYSVVIFESTNTGIDAYLAAIISSVTRIVGAAAYIMMADRFPRKSLFVVPMFMVGVSLTVLGAFFFVQLSYDVSSVTWLPLVSIISFTLFTGIYYPALMLLWGELIPTSIRSLATGIYFSLVSICMFIATASFPYMVDLVGSHWSFWSYGFVAFLMVVIVLFFIPETRGKTLEEISNMRNEKLKTKTSAT